MSEPSRVRPTGRDEEDVQALGRELARTFLLALSTIRTHGDQNQISIAAGRSFAAALNRTIGMVGSLEMRIVEDFLYLGGERLRPPRTEARIMQTLLKELARRGIGEISTRKTINETEALRFFLVLQENQAGGEAGLARIQRALQAASLPFRVDKPEEVGTGVVHGDGPADPSLQGVPGIRLVAGGGAGSEGGKDESSTPSQDSRAAYAVRDSALAAHGADGAMPPTAEGPVSQRSRFKRAFFTALAVSGYVYQRVRLGERLEIRHAKRAVQNLVDLILEDESAILGLMALRKHDNYSFFHSVNVCVLSVGLGTRLGLTRDQLLELGTSALLHDVGKAQIPASILNRPGALTEAERAVIQSHPRAGVLEILRMGGIRTHSYPAMIACFEHHMSADGSPGGYPILSEPYRPHLYGRIVAIADCYDALSTKRIYMKEKRRQDRVLSMLMSRSGITFDPVLLKLFINQVGIYPVGTVVRLASGRVAVVMRGPADPERCHRPTVLLIDRAKGVPGSESIDLSRQDASGRWPDEIIETLEAEEAGVDLTTIFQ
jgi:HD-GYP domain-containing protein (c-di-GMP phosphodiesterase class II)